MFYPENMASVELVYTGYIADEKAKGNNKCKTNIFWKKCKINHFNLEGKIWVISGIMSGPALGAYSTRWLCHDLGLTYISCTVGSRDENTREQRDRPRDTHDWDDGHLWDEALGGHGLALSLLSFSPILQIIFLSANRQIVLYSKKMGGASSIVK